MSEFEDQSPLQASDTTSALDVRSCLSATLFHLITEPVMSLAPIECAAVTQLGSMQSHSRLSTLVQCPRASLPISQRKISQVSAVARFRDFQSVEEQTENCSPSKVRLQDLCVHHIAIQQTMEISRSLVA